MGPPVTPPQPGQWSWAKGLYLNAWVGMRHTGLLPVPPQPRDPRETFSRAELSETHPVLLKKRMHTFTATKIWELGLGVPLNERVPRF